jgi:multidrug efflux pump subunit AcrB
LRDNTDITSEEAVLAAEEGLLDSFPLMMIVMTMCVVFVFHVFVHPFAVKMANQFAN